jgi:uncharacterized protein YigA (DUF484 family)
MNAPDVADYLKNNPDFFEQYADLLSSVNLSHPHGNRAISLSERQIMTLREKNKALELRLAELLRFGKENEAIFEKLQRFTRNLLLQRNARHLPDALIASIEEIFSVPQVALRIWDASDDFAGLAIAAPVPVELIQLANQLRTPHVGAPALEHRDALALLDRDSVHSLAMIALRRGAAPEAYGILVLASADPKRFQSGMGTDVLTHLGEVSSAALTRILA